MNEGVRMIKMLDEYLMDYTDEVKNSIINLPELNWIPYFRTYTILTLRINNLIFS